MIINFFFKLKYNDIINRIEDSFLVINCHNIKRIFDIFIKGLHLCLIENGVIQFQIDLSWIATSINVKLLNFWLINYEIK